MYGGDPLPEAAEVRRQSSWLFLATVFDSGFGFVFWALAIALVPDTDAGLATVGLAATVVSLSQLSTNVAILGMNNGIIRFIAQAERPRRLVAQVVLLSGAVGALAGTALTFLLLGPALGTDLTLLPVFALLGLGLAVFQAWFQVNNATLLAAGRTPVLAGISLVFGAGKLLLLLAVVSLGVVAILTAYAIPLLIAVALGFVATARYWPSRNPTGRPYPLRLFMTLSLGNYVSRLLWSLPNRLAPVLILLVVDAAAVAPFFIALRLAEVVNYIPESLGKTVFAHGSRADGLTPGLIVRLRRWILLLMIPIVILGIVLSETAMGLIGGPTYAAHALALQLFLLAVLPRAVLQLIKAQYNVERRMGALVLYGWLTGLSILFLFVVILVRGDPVDSLASAWVLGSAFSLLVNWYVVGWADPERWRAPGSGKSG